MTHTIIGTNTSVDFIGYAENVPAKVDTGADSTAVWASNIYVDKKGILHFTLFGPESDFYTGDELVREDFSAAHVRSSNGDSEVRFRTHFSIRIGGRRMKVLCNLSDRSRNAFPVLIGRRTLHGKFLVDVVRREHPKKPSALNRGVNDELLADKHEFYKKYCQ